METMTTETAPERRDNGYRTLNVRETTRSAVMRLSQLLTAEIGVRVAHSDSIDALLVLAEKHPEEFRRIVTSPS